MSPLIKLRDFKFEDKSFIAATFLRGLYYGDSWFSEMPKDVFMQEYKKVIEALLVSPNHLVRVACLSEDEDIILGYSILGVNNTIDWVYVKAAWRKQGIGRHLLPIEPTAVTHLSALGRQLLPKLPNCIFNPFAI